MKHIIKSIFILFVPFYFFNIIFIFSKSSTTDFLELKKLKNVPASIQIANTGSSHGWDFNYDGLTDKTTFNFSLRAQTLLYDKAVLSNFIDNFAPESVLLIPVSYFEIDSIPAENLIESFEFRYYLTLQKKNIPNSTLAKEIKYKYFILLTQNNPLKTIKSNFLKSVEQLKKHKSKKNENSSDGNFSLLSDLEQRKQAEFVKSSWQNMYKKKGLDYNKKILCEMIELCRKNCITPVIVTTPITSVQNSVFEDGIFFQTFNTFKNDLTSKTKVLWLDYSNDKNFSSSYDLFSDTNHMNKKGSNFFTKKVLQDLKELNLLK